MWMTTNYLLEAACKLLGLDSGRSGGAIPSFDGPGWGGRWRWVAWSHPVQQ